MDTAELVEALGSRSQAEAAAREFHTLARTLHADAGVVTSAEKSGQQATVAQRLVARIDGVAGTIGISVERAELIKGAT